MCGIVGVLQKNLRPEQWDHLLMSMTNMLVHRGPDDAGWWHDAEAGVGLGHRRLSIIDLSQQGHQPMFSASGRYCITYNGEVYNFRELSQELQQLGHSFRGHSDTEVILAAVEQWGLLGAVKRFIGMFAFAIWNKAEETLFVARDRIGEKPLYYYQDTERLIFASEIKAILSDRTVPRELNPRGLSNFLAFGHSTAPETIYQNINKLLPGHYMIVKNGRIQIARYWDVGEEPNQQGGVSLKEDEYAEKLLNLLDDSVKRRMIADVPVGAFLSGGVDSSVVVALMRNDVSGPIKTFSLGFNVGGAYNELADARRVAAHFKTDHYELNVEHMDLIQTLRTLVYHYDEPFGDAASFPLYCLSRFARDHVKVVLSGDGGDELFGGYRRYVADQTSVLYRKLPGALRETIIPEVVQKLPRLRRIKRAIKTLPIEDPARRYASWLILFSPELQVDILSHDIMESVLKHDPSWPYFHYYYSLNHNAAADHLNRLMYVDLKTWLADVYMEKTDKATMACSLEARLPLLDHRLVELAFQIPSRFKIKGWKAKQIFKKAVGQLIPDFVLRKRKHGFAVPTDTWFRGDLKEFTFEILLDQKARRRGYFNMSFVERLWSEHQEGRHVWDTHLWLLLNFELWHRIYIDGEGI